MYIRTKDGVYEVVGFDEECIIPSPLIKVKNEYSKEKITHCCKDDIIAQSENLEELCDEFVITCVEDYEYKHFYPKIADINDASEYATEDVYTVYGAIWTSKGLIYVAKMNSEGKLVLI